MDGVTRHKDYELRIAISVYGGRYTPKMMLQRATGGSGPFMQELPPDMLGSLAARAKEHGRATAYERPGGRNNSGSQHLSVAPL